MLTEPKSIQALELWPINGRKEKIQNTALTVTHLAVNFGLDAEIDHGKNYGYEARQARNGVDLSTREEQIQTGENSM